MPPPPTSGPGPDPAPGPGPGPSRAPEPARGSDPGPGARGTGAAYVELRRTLLGLLRGTVLEIGAGDGRDLARLPEEAGWLGLEPDARVRRRLARRAEDHGRPGSVLAGVAEALPFADGSLDAVLGSVVLCSVRDQAAALAEIRRALRPGGLFVFFEHVAAPEGTWQSRIQRAYAPFSRAFDAGCDPTRPTARRIAEAGFTDLDLRWFDLGSRLAPLGPYIAGCAVR